VCACVLANKFDLIWFLASKCTKNRFRTGLRPYPSGELTTLPKTPVGWEGDTPSPYPCSSTPSAPRSRRLYTTLGPGLSLLNSFRHRCFVVLALSGLDLQDIFTSMHTNVKGIYTTFLCVLSFGVNALKTIFALWNVHTAINWRHIENNAERELCNE